MDLDDLGQAWRDYQRAVAQVEVAKAAAERRVADARARVDTARGRVHAVMVELADEGYRPVEIQRITGYTKERVRQILRAGGVEPE